MLDKASSLARFARILLGVIFASAALNYFCMVLFGWSLLPISLTARGLQWSGDIIRIGYLWPLMKLINLVAGLLLIFNRAPALALALLLPVTVVIVWFQVLLNPLPGPLATTVIAVVCELILLRAYASRFAGLLLANDASESIR